MCGDGKESYRPGVPKKQVYIVFDKDLNCEIVDPDDIPKPRLAKELKQAAKELEKKNKKRFSTGTDLQEDSFR